MILNASLNGQLRIPDPPFFSLTNTLKTNFYPTVIKHTRLEESLPTSDLIPTLSKQIEEIHYTNSLLIPIYLLAYCFRWVCNNVSSASFVVVHQLIHHCSCDGWEQWETISKQASLIGQMIIKISLCAVRCKIDISMFRY